MQGGISTFARDGGRTHYEHCKQRATHYGTRKQTSPRKCGFAGTKERIEGLEKACLSVFSSSTQFSPYFASTSKIGDKYASGKNLPVAVELPEGVYAYTIDENQDLRNVTKYKLLGDGKFVPANTPVILMSDKSHSRNFKIVFSSKSFDSGLLGPTDLEEEGLDFDKFDYYYFR